MIEQILIVGLLAAFLIVLSNRTGLRGYATAISKGKITDLLQCDFCICFWVNTIVAVTFALCAGNYEYIIVPFFSTPFTRILV